MTNPIVIVNVSQTVAPAPSELQQTGAFVSQGGTTTTAQTLTLLTQISSLAGILAGAKTISGMSLSSGTVTVTTASPHGWTTGDIIPATIAGVTPAAYNGTFEITITGASTFTYPLSGSPGSVTVQGVVTLEDVAELVAMNTTFFAQPNIQSVYVLELGESTVSEGVTALTTWINANPLTIYSWLVPREWDNVSQFLTFVGNYTALNAMTYFFVTTTTATYSGYANKKCVLTLVEAPSLPATEFSNASDFAVTLSYAPTSSNPVSPLAFSFLYGVSAYPLSGNGSILTSLLAANVNYVGTGAEGGISNTLIRNGRMMDGNPFNYWYSVDWVQINLNLNISNEVINGSNNKLAPLFYNQLGINRLQNRAAATMRTAVTYGLALGTVVLTALPAQQFATNVANRVYAGQIPVNAEPFTTYTTENPNDYAIGKYGGIAVAYTPARGFEQVIVNLNVSDLVS